MSSGESTNFLFPSPSYHPVNMRGDESRPVTYAAYEALMLAHRTRSGKAKTNDVPLADRMEALLRKGFQEVASGRLTADHDDDAPLFRLTCERDDLGYLLHTALRKSCDSKPTSAAWCLLMLMVDQGNEHWGAYLDKIWDALQREHPATQWEVALVVREASIEDYKHLNNRWLDALFSIQCLFTDDDWMYYTSLISVWGGYAKPLEGDELLAAIEDRREARKNG